MAENIISKIKIQGIEYDVRVETDSVLSETSTNPIQNNVVNAKFKEIEDALVGAPGTGTNAEIFNDYTDNKAVGNYSHAEGYRTTTVGEYAHAEGYSESTCPTTVTYGTNNSSVIETWKTTKFALAKGKGSHTEGYNTLALGDYSHAEGSNNIASEENSHAEGEGSTASGLHSHAEGLNVVASALAAHAEGTLTIVDGQSAHAEGFQTASMGYASHAEGYGTYKIPDTITSSTANSTVIEAWQSSKFIMAKGRGSHAEGYDTLAVSTYAAHAEGGKTLASGNYSHAEGEYSTASGLRAHAEGYQTIASSTNQHVQGRYNIEDTASKYAHIVGNGSYNTDRSNAHTLDWNGNGWFKGDVYVGGNNQDEGSPLVKKSDASWTLLYDSGEISSKVNSISNINVSGYTNIQVAVRCYNKGDSTDSRTGSAIFTATNGKTYQFPVWTSMFSKTTSTTSAIATFNLASGWLICPSASRLTGSVDIFSTTEGGTSGNLTHTGSGILKCSSALSTLTISSLDQSAQHYFGSGSRVMVWGCKV